MPVNFDKKIIFIHIPKTAGESVEKFFDMQSQDSLFNPRSIYNYSPQHYPVDFLKKIIKEYDRMYKFSIVRNPYTRIVSEYFFINNQTQSDFNPIEFHNWLELFLTEINTDHKDLQSNFIDNSVNRILRFENLNEDFGRLKLDLLKFWSSNGIEYMDCIGNKKLPHENKTIGDKQYLVENVLDKKSKELIAEVYKTDFINLGYDI